MSFLFPLGLAGLACLPIILFLHLRRHRFRRFPVSDLGLWSFLTPESMSRKRRRLPVTPLLIADLLLGVLFSLALAQPQIHFEPPVLAAKQKIILVDVSTSMLARDGATSRLDQAKLGAQDLLAQAGSRGIVTLLAFGSQARILGDSRQDEPSQLRQALDTLEAGETGSSLFEALALAEAAVDPRMPAEIYIFTDGAFPLPADASRLSGKVPRTWHFLGTSASNQAVLAIQAVPAGPDQVQVFARVANFGPQPVDREVVLTADGRQASRNRLALPPDSTVGQVWEVAGPPSEITVSLQGQDVLREDDFASAGLRSGGKIQVVIVAENPGPLQQAFMALPDTDVRVLLPEDFSSRPSRQDADLIVFRNYLPEAWPQGPILLVDPPEGAGLSGGQPPIVQGKQRLPASLPLQAAADPVVQGVDFGGVRWSSAWKLAGSLPAGEVLLSAGGIPLLVQLDRPGPDGLPLRAWILLADLEQGNFTKHPAFPILMANLVGSLRGDQFPSSVPAGTEVRLPDTGSFSELKVSVPGQEQRTFNRSWPSAWQATLWPGIYKFELATETGAAVQFLTGVNAGDPQESNLQRRDWTEQAQSLGVLAKPAAAQAARTPQPEQNFNLAPALLALALAALVVEAALAWRSPR